MYNGTKRCERFSDATNVFTAMEEVISRKFNITLSFRDPPPSDIVLSRNASSVTVLRRLEVVVVPIESVYTVEEGSDVAVCFNITITGLPFAKTLNFTLYLHSTLCMYACSAHNCNYSGTSEQGTLWGFVPCREVVPISEVK